MNINKMHCTNCNYEGFVKEGHRGSFIFGLFLFLFFIIPGVLYFIWMMCNSYDYCPDCKCENLILLTKWDERKAA